MINIRTFISPLIAVTLASLAVLLAPSAKAGQALAVSADAAQVAVSQGAFVLDLRSPATFAAGSLPNATNLPSNAASRTLEELAQLLSHAGADSSRTLLIVGEAGDANAQALWQRLGEVASGRVLWLVGGVREWQMTGRALSFAAASNKAIPQFLTPFATESTASRMAGSRIRSGVLLERNLMIQVAGLTAF